MNEQKEFKPYIPAERVTPELTVTSIVMGIILASYSAPPMLTLDFV